MVDAETSEAGQESTCSSRPADAKIGDVGEGVRQGRMCEREQNKKERDEKQEKFGGGGRCEKIRGQPATDCLYRLMTPAVRRRRRSSSCCPPRPRTSWGAASTGGRAAGDGDEDGEEAMARIRPSGRRGSEAAPGRATRRRQRGEARLRESFGTVRYTSRGPFFSDVAQ